MLFFVLMPSFCSAAELWGKAEKPCENCRCRRCQRKGEEPPSLRRKERDQMSERKPWNDTPGMLPPIQVLVQHQKLTGDLKFPGGLKLAAMVFPSFLYVSRAEFVCLLSAQGNEALLPLLSPPVVPSAVSISQKSFQVILTKIVQHRFSKCSQLLINRKTGYCYICLYYQKSIFKVLANPHIWSSVEHTIKRWALLLRIYRVTWIVW